MERAARPLFKQRPMMQIERRSTTCCEAPTFPVGMQLWRRVPRPNCRSDETAQQFKFESFHELEELAGSVANADANRCGTGNTGPRLCRKAEDTLDEAHLTDSVDLREPADLPLADDIHCFVPRNRVQRTVDLAKPLTDDDPLLHVAMVLLENDVHVRRPPTLATLAQSSRAFQVRYRGGVRRVPIDIDDAMYARSLRDDKLEKSFRCKRIAIWREKEINGVAG